MAILGIPMAIIPVLGPTIGGLIVNYFPWQYIFAVNIPICVAALILCQIYLPLDSAVNKEQRLDSIGLLLLSPAFCAIIFGISKFRSEAGAQMAGLYLAAGALLLVGYCIYALRGKKEPPLNIRLFKDRNFSASTILIFLYGMFSTGTLFVLPLFFQHAYEASAMAAGLLLAPQGIGMLLTRTLSARFTEKVGARPVVFAGIFLTLLGTVPLALFHADGNLIFPSVILLIRGAGLGILLVPVMSGIYSGLDKKDVPQGTTATRIFQQIGSASGTAALAIILSHDLAAATDANIFAAFDPVFWWSAAFAAVSVIPVFFITKKSSET
jgi:MFS family permease